MNSRPYHGAAGRPLIILRRQITRAFVSATTSSSEGYIRLHRWGGSRLNPDRAGRRATCPALLNRSASSPPLIQPRLSQSELVADGTQTMGFAALLSCINEAKQLRSVIRSRGGVPRTDEEA